MNFFDENKDVYEDPDLITPSKLVNRVSTSGDHRTTTTYKYVEVSRPDIKTVEGQKNYRIAKVVELLEQWVDDGEDCKIIPVSKTLTSWQEITGGWMECETTYRNREGRLLRTRYLSQIVNYIPEIQYQPIPSNF